MSQKLRGSARAILLGTIAFAALTGRAQAQSADADNANEIVVTANRRAETVQDVPSAITAISQAQIEQRGMDGFEGFARSVPGLTMNQPTRNRAVFNIRGISTNVLGGATQDPVSVYIDDTPVTDTFSAIVQPDLRLFDVERIEVLRGPQGTLFGSGSLGGTIRIITNKPDNDRFEAAGRVDLGTTKGGGMRQRYDAMVNVPLVEGKLALRAVGYYRNEGGWVRNITLGTRNDTIDWGGRVALQWTPSADLTVRAQVLHQDSDPEDGDAWSPMVGKFKKSSLVVDGRAVRLTNYNFNVDYNLEGFATVTSSTTYQKTGTALHTDVGPLFGPGTHVIATSDPWSSRFMLQEVRLVSNTSSPFQWVLGGFYIDRKTATPNYIITALGLDALFGGTLGSDIFFKTDIRGHSTELAGYADGTYEIAEGLKIRGGVRLFHTTAQYDERGRVQFNFATGSYDPPVDFVNNSSGTHTTWRAGLSYEPTQSLLFYANVSKGFRVGQVNANRGPSVVDPTDYVIREGYDPDTTINYEVGAKTSFADGRVTLNLAGFYIDWKNIQIDGQRRSDFLGFVANAGEATVKGVELEVAVRPTKQFSFNGSVTVQDGKIGSLPTNIIVPAASGDRLPGLARWKLSGGIEYRWDVGGGNQAYVQANGQFTDASPNAFANGGLNPLYAINDEYATLDAAIGVDTRWGNIVVYGENLTNNDALILKNLAAVNGYTTLRPRTFGARLTYKY